MKKILYYLSKSSIFLLMMLGLTLIITNILFVFNITITRFHLPIMFFLTLIIYYLFYKKDGKKKALNVMVISIIVFTIFTIFIGNIYDSTSDGNTYHKLAVGCMKNGWNPVYQDSEDFNKKQGNKFDILDDNVNTKWIDHYAKGTEIFGAVVYSFTNNIESGKVYTLLWIYIAFGIALSLFVKMRLSIFKSFLISLILSINPITIVQVVNYYVDGVLTLSIFLIIICTILLSKFKNIEDKKEIYLILSLSILWCINSKFTGLGFAGVFCFVMYLFNLIKLYRKDKIEFKKVFKVQTIFYIIVLFVSVIIVGASSYTRNIIDHGHPFYPLYGKGHVQNMVMMEIPSSLSDKNRFTIFLTSIFAKGQNVSPTYSDANIQPELKIPFTFTKTEILNYSIPDIRMAGFGPLFSGVFILSIILGIYLLTKFIKNKKIENLILSFIMLVTICALLFLIDGNYWARYIPYFYIIPIFILLFIFKENMRKKNFMNYLGIVMYTIIVINTSMLIYSQILSCKSSNEYINYHLDAFVEYTKNKDEVEIKLSHSGIQGVLYNLDDLGINNYKLVNDESLDNDAYMFKY
ncbi:MAG: hypothetical protein J6J17_03435 [Bacilli bacterium]|nr:hypothetical protein [Bacilli bacterium]